MILAVDAHYSDSIAKIAGLSFSAWDSDIALSIHTSQTPISAEYKPGLFYKRELPCIVALLEEHRLNPEAIVIDGYVYLDGNAEAGLGKHLFDHLGGEVAVIGVAKSKFRQIPVTHEILRGRSAKPLYVTSEGLDLFEAKRLVRSMHGKNRIPTLLKLADSICRGDAVWPRSAQ